MNRKNLYGVLFIVGLMVSMILYNYKLYYYLIVSATASIVLLLSFIISKDTGEINDIGTYKYELNKILKTYSSLLVNTDNLPKLKNKSILRTQTFEDLLDAQAETRKPIYYVSKEDSTVFYIINGEVFLMYMIKSTDNEFSSLELEIKKNELEEYYNLDKVSDFDKTIILNTDEKSIRISPIRDK